jgi:hypothetical protein
VIHLIGVNHRVQWERLPSRNCYVPIQVRKEQARYSALIEDFLRKFDSRVVAEEYTAAKLEESKSRSILFEIKSAYEISNGVKIEHIFAEPCTAEKEARGYKEPEAIEILLKRHNGRDPTSEEIMAHVIAHQHPIREGFWLDRIRNNLNSDILFVCGDIHLATFPILLQRERISHEIIEDRVGVRNTTTLDYRALEHARSTGMLANTDCFCREKLT